MLKVASKSYDLEPDNHYFLQNVKEVFKESPWSSLKILGEPAKPVIAGEPVNHVGSSWA